jgi:hypothetical protein
MRLPLTLVREIRLRGLLHLCAFVGGTPALAVLNPLFWVLTVIWFAAQPEALKQVFPAPVYYVGLVLWAFGNFLLWYLTVLTARYTKKDGLVLAAALVPVYWVMMSIAAVKAVWQLVVIPSFWEKTTHGLDAEVAEHDAARDQGTPDLRLVS